MRWFWVFCGLGLSVLAGASPLRLIGYRWEVQAVQEEILAPEKLSADVSELWCRPDEYPRWAGIFVGENLKGMPAEALWSDAARIGAVREYVQGGGVIILSGGAVNGLAGAGRRLEAIQELIGFAGTARLNREACGGVKMVSGENIWLWQEGAHDIATGVTSAEVLGVFVVADKEYPAVTLNRLGQGRVYWISPLFYRLKQAFQKGHKSLGAADDEGRFVVSPEGEALEALRQLYLQCLLNVPGLAESRTATAETAKPAAETAKPAEVVETGWGLTPLGAAGTLNYAGTEFKNQPVFRPAVRPAPGLILYGAGDPAVIVVPAGADGTVKALAAELAWHLQEMTGADFAVLDQAPAGRVALVFGDAAMASAFGVDYGQLPEQTAILQRREQQVLIGGDAIGMSFALSYLLESLGCRYLWPGPSGKVIPRRKSVVLPDLTLHSVPAMRTRGIRQPSALHERYSSALKRCGIDPVEFAQAYHAAAVDHPGNRDFYRWHGVNQTERGGGFGHAFGQYHARFGASRPDFFALQPNGSRNQDVAPDRSRLCKSNVDLARAVAADKIAELRQNPALDCVSLCPNDGGYNSFCLCVECRRLDPLNAAPISMLIFHGKKRETVDYVALSDRILTFSNRIAEQVTAALPGKHLGIYVYSSYGKPPVAVKPHPALRLAATNASYTDDRAREAALHDLAAWSSFGNPMIWRPNALWGFNALLMPQNYARKLFADVETLKANGFIGTDFDCNELLWSTKGLMYYTLAKALWNPDQLDFDAYFRDYCESGFGPAAAEIMAYFNLLEKTSDRAAAEAVTLGECFDEEVIAALQARLDAARTLAAEAPAVLERIEFLQTGLEAGRLNRALHVAKKANAPHYRTLQLDYMEFLRVQSRRNPVAMNPMFTGFYNAFVR